MLGLMRDRPWSLIDPLQFIKLEGLRAILYSSFACQEFHSGLLSLDFNDLCDELIVFAFAKLGNDAIALHQVLIKSLWTDTLAEVLTYCTGHRHGDCNSFLQSPRLCPVQHVRTSAST